MGNKELIIVGGANGSGKTTFAEEYASRHGYAYLGLDAVAAELSPNAPDLVSLTAGREFMDRLAAALAGPESLVVESTLAGRTFRHVIRDARAAGFSVAIIYVFLESVATCVERVRRRVQKGGHSVPESDIRRRFPRSLRNFWQVYRPLADHWLLVYNGGREPVDVAAGTAAGISVRDAELFALFGRLTEGDAHG